MKFKKPKCLAYWIAREKRLFDKIDDILGVRVNNTYEFLYNRTRGMKKSVKMDVICGLINELLQRDIPLHELTTIYTQKASEKITDNL